QDRRGQACRGGARVHGDQGDKGQLIHAPSPFPRESSTPHHPSPGNREWGIVGMGNDPRPTTPPVGIGNRESGRKSSPPHTPPPFFPAATPPLHHSPFPRFPIPDC